MWRRNTDLEHELRKNRPQPSAEFLRLAVGKVEAEGGGRPSRSRGWIARPLVTLAAGAAVVIAFAALGGFSGLKSSVGQSAKLSPFEAAALNYCTQTTTLSLAVGQSANTTTQPINFSVDFHQPVLGFTNSDVHVTGTAGGSPTVVVTPTGANTYNIAVSGFTSAGTVTVDIPGGAATDGTGTCSTQPSNSVTVNYSTLALTAYNPDGSSGNGSLSGTGAVSGTVTVTVCKAGFTPPCTGNVLVTTTAAAGAGGTFTTGNITTFAKHTTYKATAAQGSFTSPVFTFLTSG